MLSFEGSELLLHNPVPLILHFLDLAGLLDFLFEDSHISLLSLNLRLEVSQYQLLLFHSFLVILEDYRQSGESLFSLHLVSQQVVVVILLGSQLVSNVLIGRLDHLVVGEQFLDRGTFLAIELVEEALMSYFLLGLVLSLQLFVLVVSQLLLFLQLLPLVAQRLGHLSQHEHLDVKVLNLHLCLFDFLPQLLRLFQRVLVVSLGLEVCFNFLLFLLQCFLFSLLLGLERRDELYLEFVSVEGLFVEGFLSVLVQLVFQVRRLRLVAIDV